MANLDPRLEKLVAQLRARGKESEALHTFVRAYCIGAAFTTIPGLFRILKKRHSLRWVIIQLIGLVGRCLRLRGLPAAMGIALGGGRLLEPRISRWSRGYLQTDLGRRFLTTWASSVLSSLTAFTLYKEGKETLPLTFLMFVRASDAALRGLYAYLDERYRVSENATVRRLADCADGILFWAASWRIMWCWFYLPQRLPEAYNTWINKLARTDPNVLALVKHAHEGNYVYGQQAAPDVEALCMSAAHNMNKPAKMTLPHLTSKMDCLFVHGRYGRGPCEINFLKRWLWGFTDALVIYLPLHIIPQLIYHFNSVLTTPGTSALHALRGAARSSAFLATFISSIFGMVCLVRTRLQQLVPSLDSQFLESGIAEGLGCVVCGLSIFIENRRRRREMALYVAPRALTTLLERFFIANKRHTHVKSMVENILFATSTGTLISVARHRPELLSGLIKGILTRAVK